MINIDKITYNTLKKIQKIWKNLKNWMTRSKD